AMKKTKRISLSLLLIIIVSCPLFLFFPASTSATSEYALQTGYECRHCHVDQMGGGQLTEAGRRYLDELKEKGRYRPLSFAQHTLRLIVGYTHMLAAIAWFGTIIYVHLLLKPAYASKGLPKGELRLGWISMIVILITGVLLTIARVPSWSVFYTTRFGILLSIKIFLFLIMLSSAVLVTIFIGPRLRKQRTIASSPSSGPCTLDALNRFDGKEGRSAHIAFKGIIYDVTNSRFWKNGSHAMKHAAGNDLTNALKNAPHGEDKILALPRVGDLMVTGETAIRPFHE